MIFELLYEWKWTTAYVGIHLLTFILYKYYFLASLIRSQSDPEIQKKFAPFLRNDLHNLNIITAFPFYILYWPKIFLGWGWIMIVVTICLILLRGYDKKDYLKLSGWKYELVKVLMKSCARLCLFLTCYFWVEHDKDHDIDYSEFLGPDWKAEWDGAPTYVANHTSWLDIMYMITYFYPGFVARSTVEKSWGVGPLATILGSVYINRVDGSKDAKKAIFQEIMDRQNNFVAGKAKAKFAIFPEGCTTNGKYLLSFKKGAFMSLNAVQPVTALSHS